MQYLVLLRGAPGSGKSTWILQNNLQEYTLCPDDLRVYVQSPTIDLYGNKYISQANDHFVWDLLFNLLDRRMEKGELTVIDATHSRAALINRYQDLCDRYRYRMIVIEFPNDPETILKRNKDRDQYKIVPEEAILNHIARINAEKTPKRCTVLKPDEWINFSQSHNLIYDFNKWKSIWVFGDIHGCFEPLDNFFKEHPYNEENFYIFTGDYFDRGIQNSEVFNLLEVLIQKDNTLFLRGNHEYHLWDYSLDGKSISPEFNNITMKQFINNGITPSRIRSFYRKIAQMAFFNYGDKVFFINHAGIPVMPSIFISSSNFAKGIGKYEDIETVERSWSQNTPYNYYQIHGHRNIMELPIFNPDTRCYNLEGKVEFGGNLRILQLTKENK